MAAADVKPLRESHMLCVQNVVATFLAQMDGMAPDMNDAPLNVEAISLAAMSKLSLEVFPASMSKSRCSIRNAVPFKPDPQSVYPLKKKPRSRKAPDDDDDDDDDDASNAVDDMNNLKVLSRGGFVKQKATSDPAYRTATCMSYHSKENLIAGGKSIALCLLNAYAFARRVSADLGIHLRVCNFQTQNIVCSATLEFELNLNWLYQYYMEDAPLDCGVKVLYKEPFSGLNMKVLKGAAPTQTEK